jgi:hypothetical protein
MAFESNAHLGTRISLAPDRSRAIPLYYHVITEKVGNG